MMETIINEILNHTRIKDNPENREEIEDILDQEDWSSHDKATEICDFFRIGRRGMRAQIIKFIGGVQNE